MVQCELALSAPRGTNLPPHSSAIQRTVSSARETRTFPSTDAPRCTSVVWCPRSVHPLQAKCQHFNFYFTTTQLQPKRNVAKTASPWFPFFWTYKFPHFSSILCDFPRPFQSRVGTHFQKASDSASHQGGSSPFDRSLCIYLLTQF